MQKLRQQLSTIKSKLFGTGRRSLTICMLLGFAGMLLILFSGNDSKEVRTDTDDISLSAHSTDYCAAAEKRLEELLSAIDGVGEVRVMITAGSSEEYVYARREESSKDRKEQDYVILKKGSEEEALVRNVLSPEITGVAVVCRGGNKDRVREEVYNTVTAVLGINPGRVYVAQMK